MEKRGILLNLHFPFPNYECYSFMLLYNNFLNISIVYGRNIPTSVLDNAATQTKPIFVNYIILKRYPL